jgi:phosphatidylglycerophosphatase A
LKGKIYKFIGSAFGLGFLPLVPGTWGTLLGIPLALWLESWGVLQYMGITLLVVGLSILMAELCAPHWEELDSPHFVLDEVAGYLITMVMVPLNWRTMTAGFILFRILDMWKPGPIRALERRVPGGLGVTLDDVAAGMIASLLLQGLLRWENARPYFL